jgi:SAM-dependent methyltransferase
VSDHVFKTHATYDRIAPRFLANTRDRSVMAAQLDAFVSALPAAALVLDLGAGPGLDSAELRVRGLRVVSIDLSLGMLQVGAAEFPGARVQADIRELPVRTASVAGAWANACLLHLQPHEATDRCAKPIASCILAAFSISP